MAHSSRGIGGASRSSIGRQLRLPAVGFLPRRLSGETAYCASASLRVLDSPARISISREDLCFLMWSWFNFDGDTNHQRSVPTSHPNPSFSVSVDINDPELCESRAFGKCRRAASYNMQAGKVAMPPAMYLR